MPKKTNQNNMRIVIHDFGGYGFPYQLSESLSRLGHDVIHLYCASHQTTPLGILKKENTPNQLDLRPIRLDEPLNKFNFFKRWKQENAYGRLAAAQVKELSPDVVISANAPLDTQTKLLKTCRQANIPFVTWLQDLIGVATHQILKQKIPVLGSLVGKYYLQLEKNILKKSSAIVTISEDFETILTSWGIDLNKIHFQPNWAPINWIPVQSRNNEWSKAHDLDHSFCFMYTGTLGMKHNPELLLKLAQSFADKKDVNVVVVSQGMGATWLAKKKEFHGVENLLLLPYQPAASLPLVIGSSDVLVALLNKNAGKYSVPSKVLTYLCAKRPLLLAVPLSNPAAKLVVSEKAGFVADPSNTNLFIQHAHDLYETELKRATYAAHARTYAEGAFSIEKISQRFIEILSRL